MTTITQQLRTARGDRFGALLKECYYAIAPDLCGKARAIKERSGQLTIIDVAILAIEFDLQLKHCFDFLEDPIAQVLPSGTYERLQWKGLNVEEVMSRAKKAVESDRTND